MDKVTAKQFGYKLKVIRENQGFSLRQASNQSKIDNKPAISPSYWSLVERGERNIPKIETLERMAKGLRISTDRILSIAGISIDDNTPDWATESDKNDLEVFLRENAGSMTYQGENLTEEEKEKLQIAMTQIFWKRHKHSNGSEGINE